MVQKTKTVLRWMNSGSAGKACMGVDSIVARAPQAMNIFEHRPIKRGSNVRGYVRQCPAGDLLVGVRRR